MPGKSRYSPAKRAASRANGAKSLGPVTPGGKVRASQNNLRHGLLVREETGLAPLVDNAALLGNDQALPTQDSHAPLASHRRLAECLNPANELEAQLTRQISFALLRFHRTCDIQTTALRLELMGHPHLEGVNATLKAMDELLQPGRSFPLYRRYDDDEAKHQNLPFEPGNRATPPSATASTEKNEPAPEPASSPVSECAVASQGVAV